VCNEEEEADVIDALGHHPGDWHTTHDADCEHDGEEELRCTRMVNGSPCGELLETEVITKLGHDWEWVEQTPASYTTEGEEKEICKHDDTHDRNTRPIPQKPFTAITDFKTWLDSQPANPAPAEIYSVIVNVSGLSGAYNTAGTLGNALYTNRTNKFVSLDLSGSTFDSNTIPNNAFQNCSNLTSITIPSNVTSIGQQTFNGCSKLTAIDVNGDNTTYRSNDGILYNKAQTTLVTYPVGKTDASFTIPNNVTTVGTYAFYNSASLTSIIISTNITAIEASAFENCRGLTSITIPGNVKTIGTRAFYDCRGATSITIENGVTSIDTYAFQGCQNITSVIIPDSVGTIRQQAFFNCIKLESVTIGIGVTSIGQQAFDCYYLTSVTFNKAGTSLTGSYIFPSIANLRTAYTSGGAGTYIRQPPLDDTSEWVKE
jgi:hypothetical protein